MLTRLAPVLLALPLAAACGDNLSPEAPVDAAPPELDAPLPEHTTAAAVAGDFMVTGVFTTLDVETRVATPNALAGVAGGDPYLRRIGDELFIVNRDRGENVTILGGRPLALIDQFGTGGGSNPQDVAVVGNRLYVPAMGTAGVIVIDRTTRMTTTIAIPSIDPDGKPDCISAYGVGTKVFVACGVLDATFTPRGPAQIVVIDTTNNTVSGTFPLAFANPIGLITPGGPALGDDLLIATAPSFNSAASGCLARVRTTGIPGTTGCVVNNADLGAYVNRVAVSADGTKVWMAAALYASDFSSQSGTLRSFDAVGNRLEVGGSPASQQILDVATCPDGAIVVGDAKMGASGLRIYNGATEVTTAPISIGRPTGGGNGLVCW